MEDKEKKTEQKKPENPADIAREEDKIREMKQEFDDYMEEQGIYIRQ